MATWKVQQKVEMWKETTIEADNLEEALELSQEEGTAWELLNLDWEDTEEFWAESPSGNSWTVDHTGTHKN